MFKKKVKKYCPKCGKPVKPKDKYCMSCGYSFEKRKGTNLTKIIAVIIVFLALWIIIRIIVGKSIIPQPIIDLFK